MPRFTASLRRPTALRRRAWMAFALLACTFAVPAPLLAHAELVGADPLPNSSLVEAPDSVTITFSEPIDPGNATLRLLDAQLRPVANVGAATVGDSSLTIRADLPTLGAGVYTVAYQVVSSVDGHATTGRFAFVVDPTGADAPPAAPPASSSPSVDAWAVAARWLALVAGLIGLGTLATWWSAGRPTLAEGGAGIDLRPPWRLVLVAALGVVVGLALYLVLSARPIVHPGAFVLDVAAPFGWTPFAIAMRVAMIAALAAALVTGVAMAGWRRHADQRLPAGLAGGCLAIALAGMSVAGHASSLGGPLNAALDWLHLVAAAAWLGGLVAVYPLASRVAEAGGSRAAAARDILRRHGRLALVAGPLVVLTGLANSPVVLGTSRELVAGPYGNLLLGKGVLVSVALGIGAVNHLALRGHGRARVAALLSAELMVAVIAVMAAATMVTIQPGAARQAVLTGPSVQPAHFFGEIGPSSIHASVSVPAPGTQSYQVTIRDAARGGPRTDIQKVFLTFTPPQDEELAAERVELMPREIGGLYTVGGAYTPVVGEWALDVTVRRAGARDESISFGLAVHEAGPPLASPPPDTGIGVPAPLAALWGVLPAGVPGWIPGLLAIGAFGALGLRRRRPALLRAGLLAVGALLLLGAGSRTMIEAANRPTPSDLAVFAPRASGSAESGERIYLANCASCHGRDGAGDGPTRTLPAPRTLVESIAAMSDAELSYRIANGLAGTPMPAFGADLTEQERLDLVSFLRQRWGSP